MKSKYFFSLAFLSASLAAGDVSALPASARLYQQVYGYKVSCLLCHASGGGSAVTSYGKDFLRAGANSTSFKKIEKKDSDGDGIENIKEILAKANAGDKRSTPAEVGTWLDNLGSVYIPKDELEKLFPNYSQFAAVEGSLSELQSAYLQNKLSKVVDDDKVPTFYFAIKNGKKEAVGQLVSAKSSEGKTLITGIAVGTDGKILNLKVLGGELAKSADEKLNAFLKSLEGKDVSTLPAKPSSVSDQLVLESASRSLYLMQTVFGGAK